MKTSSVVEKRDIHDAVRSFLTCLAEGQPEDALKAIRDDTALTGSAVIFRDIAAIARDYHAKGKTFHGMVDGRRAVLSSRPLPDGFVRTVDEYYAGISAWLTAHLSYAESDFPYIFIHIDSDYSLIPRTYLPHDRQAVRIGIHQADTPPESLLHELMHGLSLILDRFASELLAYFAETSGLGIFDTFKRREENAGLTLQDVLALSKDDLPDVYNIFFGRRAGGAQDTGQEQYMACYLAYLYRLLEEKSGSESLKRYFTEIDTCGEGDGSLQLFRDCFGFGPDEIDRMIRASLLDHAGKTPLPEQRIRERYERDLEYEPARLIYLKTYIKKAQAIEDPQYLLRIASIDYRLYTLSKKCGYINEHLLRKTSRVVLKLVETDQTNHAAWALRFRLLTEEVTHYFRNRDAWDGDLREMGRAMADAVKTAHAMLIRLNPDCLETRLLDAQFHLFYPPAYGANRKKGLALLDVLHAGHPDLKDVYYYFAVYAFRFGKKALLREWMENYKSRFGKEMDTGFMHKPRHC